MITHEDKLIERVLNKIADRATEGLTKYGVPMTRTDKSVEFWIENAIEEALDWIIYLQKIKEVIQSKEATMEKQDADS